MKVIDPNSGYVIFGRDISRIPCFRNTFLYGIYGGITVGLARFMFTSRINSATNFGVGAFGLITTVYWIRCRYKYAESKMEMKKLQYLMQQQSVLEGTEADTDYQKKKELTDS